MSKTIFSLLFPLYLMSQTDGLVTDNNLRPIPNADVLIVSTSTLVKTADDGTFTIQRDIPSNTILYISKEGYKSKTITYSSQEKLTVMLSELHVNINEVEVSSINYKLSSNQTINIQSKKLSQLNGSSFNLVESLSNLSGVEQRSTGNGIRKVVVRGLSGMRVVTLLNGTRIENQQWGSDHGIGFTDLGIGKVELVKGPSSIIFGADALGGAIYFSDESFVAPKQLKTHLITQFESASMLFNNQIGLKWSTNTLKTNTYIEYGSAADYILPDATYLFNSRYSNFGLKTAIGYSAKNWVLNAKYQYSQNMMGIPAHSHDAEPTLDQLTSNSQKRYPTRPTQFNTLHVLNVDNHFYFGKNNLKVMLGNSINRLEEFEAWTVPEIDVYLNTTQLNLIYSRAITQSLSWKVGTQSSYQVNDNQQARTQLVPNANTTDVGLYSLLEYVSPNQLSSQLALRGDNRRIALQDDTFSKDYNALSLSLGVAKQWENHHLRMSFSTAFRTPHFYELLAHGVHHATRRYEVGDPQLKTEKGNQLDLIYEWTSDHLGFNINPFYQQISDFITLTPKDSAIKDVPLYHYEQLEQVTLKGIELNLHYHPHFVHQLHIDHSISIIEGKTQQGGFLALMPPNKFQSTLKYIFDKPHLNLDNIFVEHAFYMAQDKVADNESPSDSYGLLHAGITFSFSRKTKFNITGGVKNIMNKSYVPHLSSLKSYDIPHLGRSYFVKLITNL